MSDYNYLSTDNDDIQPCPSGGDCTLGCTPVQRCSPSKTREGAILTVSTNPKKAQGMKKPPLHLVPASAIVEMSQAFADGANKYGPFNWRIDPVDTTTYVSAAQRHLALFFNGQDRTSDTDVHNLAAVMACCAILLDAAASGTLIDDRPPAQDLEGLMDNYTVGKGKP